MKWGPFATVLEGSYNEVMALINQINEYLYAQGCAEWIANIQVQIRSNGPVTGNEKTAKFSH
jgi:uncharacterized protein YqgV (UPF0045/DUF77 family)